MNRLAHFIRQSLFGGFLVIAPIVIILLAFRWAVNGVRELIAPLASPLANASGAPPLLIDLVVLLCIFAICFVVGTLVATNAGRWLQTYVDRHLTRFAPGYRLVRDILNQILGADKNSPFNRGEVALVKLFGVDTPTMATAIITSRHPNNWYTVFVPTGPNPTSGFVYHLPPECVTPRPDIKLDAAFKSIIACGAGSAELRVTADIRPASEPIQ